MRIGTGLALIGLAVASAVGQTTVPAVRTRQQIVDDIQAAKTALGAAIGNPHDLSKPDKRAKIAEKALPELRRLVGDADALAAIEPAGRAGAIELKDNFKAIMSALGDAEATAEIDALAADPVPATAVRGKVGKLTARWMQAADSVSEQNKIGDELIALDKANPDSVLLTRTTAFLSQATPDHALTNRMVHAATEMTNSYAEKLRPVIAEPPPTTGPTTEPAGQRK